MYEAIIEKYEKLLTCKDEYIFFNDKEFVTYDESELGCYWAVICLIIYVIALILVPFLFEITFSKSFMYTTVCIICFFIITYSMLTPQKTIDRVRELKKQIIEHNKRVFELFCQTEIQKKVNNVSKEIIIESGTNILEKVIIDDINKTFNYIKIKLYSDAEANVLISQAKYSEILKYAFLNKSNKTVKSHSIQSSNSDNAITGAIISKVLVDDATVGAVIGASGERNIETTYETVNNTKYQITIYLNRLQDSLITINLINGYTTNEIISVLEYIINNK